MIARLLVSLLLLLGLLAVLWYADAAVVRGRDLDQQMQVQRLIAVMETELTVLVEREQDRPFAHYRYFYTPPDQVPGSVGLSVSPIAAWPPPQPVRCYVQVDPDGRLGSPHLPADRTLARSVGWQSKTGLESELDHITQALAVRPPEPPAQQDRQADGLTLTMVGKGVQPLPESQRVQKAFAGRNQVVARIEAPQAQQVYQFENNAGNVLVEQLRAQNRAIGDKDVVAVLPETAESSARSVSRSSSSHTWSQRLQSFPTAADSQADESLAGQAADQMAPGAPAPAADGLSASGQMSIDAQDAEEAPASRRATTVQAEAELRQERTQEAGRLGRERPTLDPTAVADHVAAQLNAAPAAPVSVSVGPFSGRDLDADRYLLERTVSTGRGTWRQGVVIDREHLHQHLQNAIAQDTDLRALATISWNDGEPQQPGGLTVARRFAAPFQDLAATLHLDPADDRSALTRAVIWGLGAVLFVLGAGTLIVIERSVQARLDFARRRQNFVAAVSHELKTPLTAIRMYAEMLKSGMAAGAEQQQRYHDTIHAESERLSRLIDNVLSLSRLEQGTLVMTPRLGPVQPVLDELVALLGPHCRELGFELQVDCPLDLQAVYDHEALLQMLVNACDNACKFAADATDRTLHISAEPQGDRVRLRVRDHGPGADPSHLAKLFDAFYRGEDEQTRRHQGTGIGLSLVHGLAERMRAAVSARNHPDGGFELCLDLAR